jgi:hypothetical protein
MHQQAPTMWPASNEVLQYVKSNQALRTLTIHNNDIACNAPAGPVEAMLQLPLVYTVYMEHRGCTQQAAAQLAAVPGSSRKRVGAGTSRKSLHEYPPAAWQRPRDDGHQPSEVVSSQIHPAAHQVNTII